MGFFRISSAVIIIVVALLAPSAAGGSPAVPRQAGDSHELSTVIQGLPPTGSHFDYVVQVIMENHAICDILTTCAGAGTYQTQLAKASGLATGYVQCGPSLPNYLCLTGASTFGCTGNYPPNSNNCTAAAWGAPNIVDRLVDAGLTWKAYMENMTTNCQSTSSGGYVVKHDPFVYYGDIVQNQSRCSRVVPAGTNASALLNDLGSTATASNYMWLTPNTCHDMEVCRISVGDEFLSTLVPQILNSTVFQTQRAALFITYDEASGGRGAPDMYTVWAGPATKANYESSAAYYHVSELATIESNWGLAPLNANDSAVANMDEFFMGPNPDFSLSANPFSLSFLRGQNATSVITLHNYLGFNWNVNLSASADRNGLNVVCSPSVIEGNQSSNCTMTSTARGTYAVTVTGVSGNLVNNITLQVRVVDPLTASASAWPGTPSVGGLVYLNATASGGTSPFTYTWALGDGTAASGSNVTHVYLANGTVTVQLHVLDSGGLDAPLSMNVTLQLSIAAIPATVSTLSASNITNVSAILHANLADLGGITALDVGFLFGTSPSLLGAASVSSGISTAPGSFSTSLTGLAPREHLYFAAWANGAGFSLGQILDFTTLDNPAPPRVAPSVRTDPPQGIGQSNATLVGFLEARGTASSVTIGFRVSVTSSMDAAVNESGQMLVGSSTFTANAANLQPSATYYVQAWADGDGFSTGAVLSFTTGAVPKPLVSPGSALYVQGIRGNAGWYTSNATVTFTVTDPQGPSAWVDYRVDGGQTSRFVAPFVLGDGAHILEYHAADAYGAPDEAGQTANVNVDTRAPTLSVEGPAGVATSSSVPIRWNGSDAGSGIAEYGIAVDGGAFQTMGMATSFTLSLTDGGHTVVVRATDVAGNSVVRTLTLRVDSNAFSFAGPYAGLPLAGLLALIAVVILILAERRRRRRNGT